MQKLCAKLVSKILTDGQKQSRVFVCEDLLQDFQEEPDFLA